MSATIVDLADYGDVKGRDNYLRNTFQSVKGDGVSPTSVTQGFYGITSGASTTEYELARFTASEGAVDDSIGTLTVGINDGGSFNDVLSINNVASEITTTTFTMTATDVVATGTIKVAALEQDTLAEGARIELVDDATDPAINFVMGTTVVTTPLIITNDEVAVDGAATLTIGGVDVLDAITDGNPWEGTAPNCNLKTTFTDVTIGNLAVHSTSLGLDLNGTMRLRGNDLLFYDQPLDAHYSALAYIEASQEVRLRASRAGDSVVIATSNGTSNNYLDRLEFTDGLGTQSATFTNVNVGIGAAPSGTWPLEVTGGASLTAGLVVGDDIDMAGNDIIHVTNIDSDVALAEQARILLTSSATDPQIDLQLGTTGSPTSIVTLTETTADINVATTIASLTVTGDLQVDGTTVTLNTSTVTVDDINIELADSATAKATVNGGGITLGASVTDYVGAIPTINYNSTTEVWETSVGLTVSAGDVTVGTSGATTLGDDLTLLSDTAYMYLGATRQWRLGMYTDGSGDHFEIAHDDLGTQTTWVTKLDVLE